MDRTFCDRCGKDLDRGQDRSYKDYPFEIKLRSSKPYMWPIELHLCKSCQKDLRKWFLTRLEPDPQPAERTEKKLWRLFRKTHDKS